MKNIFRALCAAVFLVGLMVFTLAQNSKQTEVSNGADDIEPARPCVVKVIQYRINQDGSRKDMGRSIIYSKANGEYRHIGYGSNGPKDDDPLSKRSNEFFISAGLPDGVYDKNRGSNAITYVSSRADEKMLEAFRSHNYYRNHKGLVRTDKIAGLMVYVVRTEITNPASNIEWIEKSYSPKTGFGSLRSIVHFRDGSEVRSEAVSVEFKDVPEDLNDDLKELPVTNIEEKMRKQHQN